MRSTTHRLRGHGRDASDRVHCGKFVQALAQVVAERMGGRFAYDELEARYAAAVADTSDYLHCGKYHSG